MSDSSATQPQSPQIPPLAMVGLQELQNLLNNLLNELVQSASSQNVSIPPQQANAIPARLRLGFNYFVPSFKNLYSWLYSSREDTNFTYDLSDQNKDYVASFVSAITNTSITQVKKYISELNEDLALREHVRSSVIKFGDSSMDPDARYGRRLGWYAFVRALKPKVIIETGVDKGLGSCVLASALLKNQAEGSPGYYYGTDINPNAGYLFQGQYRTVGTILYGDSIASLQQFNQPIDLFINDSDHSADYEKREYETIQSKLSSKAVLLADNAHVTNCLYKFAESTGRKFLFFQEKPKDHWYPGAGIGAAFT